MALCPSWNLSGQGAEKPLHIAVPSGRKGKVESSVASLLQSDTFSAFLAAICCPSPPSRPCLPSVGFTFIIMKLTCSHRAEPAQKEENRSHLTIVKARETDSVHTQRRKNRVSFSCLTSLLNYSVKTGKEWVAMRSRCSTPASKPGVEPPGEKTLDCPMQGMASRDFLLPLGLWAGAVSYSVSPGQNLEACMHS